MIFNIGNEILLRKLMFETPPAAIDCLDLVLKPYSPVTDELSNIDYQRACQSLQATFATLEQQPRAAAEDPNWMRRADPKAKEREPDQVTDFPRI